MAQDRKSSRARNRNNTTAVLKQAISTLKASASKISITSIALEAGVDPSLIHHAYPDIADQIRAIASTGSRVRLDDKQKKLSAARATISRLRTDIAALKSDMATLASVNLGLTFEVSTLRAELEGKVERIGRRAVPR